MLLKHSIRNLQSTSYYRSPHCDDKNTLHSSDKLQLKIHKIKTTKMSLYFRFSTDHFTFALLFDLLMQTLLSNQSFSSTEISNHAIDQTPAARQ